MIRRLAGALVLFGLPLVLAMCDAGREPQTVTLPLVVDGGGLGPCVTTEGYEVELTALRVAFNNLQFTIGGETHARRWRPLGRALVGEAYAHPGHYAGGEVTGELPGDFILDAFAGADVPLGVAALLEGDYHGANFDFRAAGAGDGLAADDPLLGHAAVLAGTASAGGTTYSFDAVLDVDAGTQMVGAPFTFSVAPATTATLALRFLTIDPSTSQGCLLDGVDFAALDTSGSGVVAIRPGDAAHNILRRNLQVHDHWWVDARD